MGGGLQRHGDERMHSPAWQDRQSGSVEEGIA